MSASQQCGERQVERAAAFANAECIAVCGRNATFTFTVKILFLL